MIKPSQKTAIIQGRKVLYFDQGNPGDPVMLLLHGYPGNYEGLMDLANNLPQNYRIITPNFPSCGGSEPFEGKQNLKQFADWLNAFLAEISVEQAVVIGHSFGSRVALTFGVNYPAKIKQLVLITPVIKADSILVYIVLLRYKLAKFLPPDLQKKFLASKLYEYIACKIVLKSKDSLRHKKIITRGFKELKNVHPETHIDLFEEFYRSDLTSSGEKIKAPALIIVGEKDEVATLKSAQELAKNMSNASLKILKNSGHLVPFESPKNVAKIITKWLSENYG